MIFREGKIPLPPPSLCQSAPDYPSSHDAISRKAREIVDMLEDDRDILSVSQLARLLDLSERSIQNICHRALGGSSKVVDSMLPPPGRPPQARGRVELEPIGCGAGPWLFRSGPLYPRFQAGHGRKPGPIPIAAGDFAFIQAGKRHRIRLGFECPFARKMRD